MGELVMGTVNQPVEVDHDLPPLGEEITGRVYVLGRVRRVIAPSIWRNCSERHEAPTELFEDLREDLGHRCDVFLGLFR